MEYSTFWSFTTKCHIMEANYLVIVVFTLLLCGCPFSEPQDSTDPSNNSTDILIGYLTVDLTDEYMRGKQGRAISGATTLAIKEINSNSSLLPGHRLKMIWGDTRANTLVGTHLLTDQWRKGAVAFIGLEDSCSVEAKVSAAWNLPMISYKCADGSVSEKKEFPTFSRTFPPASQVAKPIISLLKKYNWKKFTLIVGTSHNSKVISGKLETLAANGNITINDKLTFKEPHIPMLMGNPFPGIVERTFVDTRVYVFLGELNGMVDMMTNMYDRGLLDTGEYVVIYVDADTVDNEDVLKYFKRTQDAPLTKTNENAARSLLVIASSAPSNPSYKDFEMKVSHYGDRPPFSFPNPFKQPRKVTVFAAYLYDAMMLYARATTEVLEEGGNITNGTAITRKIIGSKYKSIQGFYSIIDDNGDAVGNYTLLARQPWVTNFSEYSMRPVGHFQMADAEIPVYQPFLGTYIDWVGGEPPIYEPYCGYRAQRCIPPKTYTLEIVGGIIGGIALIVIVIALVIYRNWRYEQEIAGLLWKISRDDLKTSDSNSTSNRRDSMGSRLTLSQISVDSRMSFTQVYARTGTYKGQIVALKLYEKKNLYISRKMQKEMKLMRDLRHTNINTFLGACIDPPSFIIVTEYCPKGSLQDILENEDLQLDDMFIASLVKDIIQGMIFLHDSELNRHGNLKSSNCVVNSRWSLQITDFGLLEVRAATYKMEDEHAYYRNLFWKAPEHLRTSYSKGSQKADIYSFGIILHEIFGRAGPFGFCNMSPKDIIDRVRSSCYTPFRPDTKALQCDKYVVNCMADAWREDHESRPDFRQIWKDLQPLRHGMKRNIFDNMMAMMEKYQKNLEDIVDERTTLLKEEKKKTEALLLRMLPRSVADQLKKGQAVEPENYSCVTIYFSDICGFTQLSAESSPMEIVDMLNDLYTIFDNTIRQFDVYKIETIGDAYMVVSGLPIRNGDNHAGEIASMSLELLKEIKKFRIRHRPGKTMALRIGMHSGPCVAGVVGLTMPRYTLFGDTVNTASRMETNGEPMKIHCSKECTDLLMRLGGYTLDSRGAVPMKGKGELFTYWLISEDQSIRRTRMKSYTKKIENINGSPITPLNTRQCCNSLYKGSNQFISSAGINADSDDNFNFNQDTNYLHLLLEPEGHTHVKRSDSPKNFPQPHFHGESPKVLHHASNNGGIPKHSTNGLLSEPHAMSSSGPIIPTVNKRDRDPVDSHDINDKPYETDNLLLKRHYSLGNKSKWRPNFLSKDRDSDIVALKGLQSTDRKTSLEELRLTEV